MFKFNQISKKTILIIVIFIFIIILFSVIYAVNGNMKFITETENAGFKDISPEYADAILKHLSQEEKIGQLIIADPGVVNDRNSDSLIKLINSIKPGGIIYKTDSLKQFISTQNLIQKYSKINLLTFWKDNTAFIRFKNTDIFPDYLIFNVLKADSVFLKFISTITDVSKNFNLSSVFTFKLNSCSSNLLNYKKRAYIYLDVCNRNHLLSFFDADLLLKNDSLLFKANSEIIKKGIAGLVLKKKLTPYLFDKIKTDFKFKGLTVKYVDSKNMNSDSLAKFINSGVNFFVSEDPGEIFSEIHELIQTGKIDREILDNTLKKNLSAKKWTSVNKYSKLSETEIYNILQSPEIKVVKQAVYKNSINVLKNTNNQIPFTKLTNEKIQLLVIGNTDLSEFNSTFDSYKHVKKIFINSNDHNLLEKIKHYQKKNCQIVALNNTLIDSSFIKAFSKNNKSASCIIINFGKPENVYLTNRFTSVIQTFGNSKEEQKYAAELLFGGISITNKFSCTNRESAYSDSVLQIKKVRVSKCLPEEVGLNSSILNRIDSVVKDGLYRGAYPGCQVVVFKNGYNIYDKAFGYHTYAKRNRVRKTDLYDLASVTKIAATTTAAMKLYSQGKLKLNDNLGRFFKDTKIDYSTIKPDTIIHVDTLKYSEVKDFKKILKYQDTLRINDSVLIAFDTLIVTLNPKNNIFKVSIRDLLMHKSGITPTLPILPYVIFKKNFYDSLEINKHRYYEKIKNDSSIKDKNIEFNPKIEIGKIYDTFFTKRYIKDSAEIKIADKFYLKNNWFDTLWRDTKRLRVYSRKIYQYSDINMILLQSAIDSLNHRSMNSFMRKTFYLPMGLRTMCYKPRRYFSLNRIVPTEDDKYWREQLLRGNVHDPSAAMLGGISGNAGLFSDAYDLAVLGQMWLNGGTYGGIRYISESTVKKFTNFQEDSFRGLGFDKQHKKAVIAKDAPPESFGHTGFTGTCIWVDPVNDIVFVFLSNRVNPSAKNWRINSLKIRQKIHQLVYDSMKIQN